MSKIDNSLVKNISVGDIKIDATDINNLKSKVVGEQETRRNMLKHARLLGCEKEMQMIFAKYDNLLRNCSDDKERADIGKLGAVEVYRLLGGGGELYINGELICKDN